MNVSGYVEDFFSSHTVVQKHCEMNTCIHQSLNLSLRRNDEEFAAFNSNGVYTRLVFSRMFSLSFSV